MYICSMGNGEGCFFIHHFLIEVVVWAKIGYAGAVDDN